MTRYQVDSEVVVSTAAALRAGLGRLQGEAAGINGLIVNLQGAWTGSASDALQALAAEWRRVQAQIEEQANSINTAIAVAGQGYSEVEAQNARMFLGR